MKKYILRYEQYEQYKSKTGINWEVEVDWNNGIRICHQLTEQHDGRWTRHPSVNGPSSHTGQYWDLYNEGSIILIPIEERSNLAKLKNKNYETKGEA